MPAYGCIAAGLMIGTYMPDANLFTNTCNKPFSSILLLVRLDLDKDPPAFKVPPALCRDPTILKGSQKGNIT